MTITSTEILSKTSEVLSEIEQAYSLWSEVKGDPAFAWTEAMAENLRKVRDNLVKHKTSLAWASYQLGDKFGYEPSTRATLEILMGLLTAEYDHFNRVQAQIEEMLR